MDSRYSFRQHRRIVARAALLIALAVVGIAMARSFFSSEEEKLAAGLLRAWKSAEIYDSEGAMTDIVVSDAVARMRPYLEANGTNAIPMLMNWIEEKPKPLGPITRAVEKCAQTLNINSPRFWGFLREVSGVRQHTRRKFIAPKAFGILGKSAEPAVPRLTEIAESSSPSKYTASEALMRMKSRGPRFPGAIGNE